MDQPSPRPLLDKLGVKPEHRVALIGAFDADFVEQLRARGASVSRRIVQNADQIYLAAGANKDLTKIGPLRKSLRKDGSFWVVRPKGPETPVTEDGTRQAGLDAGLVDVKVVAFSPTHSAMKFVYRLADR
ncbi:MAG TPA: hypothetical protein VKV69_10685 [Actinomycetota bacterium]|nr:hypothetical protein [Actinomycetota bacterium]